MTVFVRAAKELIQRALQKYIDTSTAADQGLLGSLSRELELSKEQRKCAQGLKETIANFMSSNDDAGDLARLVTLMIKTDELVCNERKNYPKVESRGTLNETLLRTLSNINLFYAQLNNILANHGVTDTEKPIFHLINRPDDNDPFNILCAYAAYYLGDNIFFPETFGFLSRFAWGTGIRQNKEQCLVRTLVKCKNHLAVMNENCDAQRKEYVSDQIKSIREENAYICTGNKPGTYVLPAISFSILGSVGIPISTPEPRLGRLEAQMAAALLRINHDLSEVDSDSISLSSRRGLEGASASESDIATGSAAASRSVSTGISGTGVGANASSIFSVRSEQSVTPDSAAVKNSGASTQSGSNPMSQKQARRNG